MKILIVPDSFKGSADNVMVAKMMAEGVRSVAPAAECTVIPLADGGEGSLQAIELNLQGERIKVSTEDSLLRPVDGYYLKKDDISFVELAQVSGLQLLNTSERNAGATSSRGTGLIMAQACSDTPEIVLCIGGSATNDAGCGIAHAMGYRFLDKNGRKFLPTGYQLIHIDRILPPENLSAVQIRVLCDVKSPFTGINGATYVYGPQKGAHESDLRQIEEGMEHLRKKIWQWRGIDLNEIAGAGAAGGVGGGMIAFFGATLESGIDYFIQKFEIEKEIQQCDLIFTGEGSIDHQTQHGKLISGITRLAAKYKKPVIGVCGTLKLNSQEIENVGLTAAFSILNKLDQESEIYKHTPSLIKLTTAQIMRVINEILWMKE